MKIMRSALLWASQSPRMERLVRSSRAMRPVVSKFMPGETIVETMAAVRKLTAENTPTIITYLGENVSTDAAAEPRRKRFLVSECAPVHRTKLGSQ